MCRTGTEGQGPHHAPPPTPAAVRGDSDVRAKNLAITNQAVVSLRSRADVEKMGCLGSVLNLLPTDGK